MKTKLIACGLALLLATACVDDYQGGDDNEEYKGILTETNYLYTEDLRAAFLEEEIAELDEEIKELQAIVDNNQADEDMIQRLDEAKAARVANADEIESIASYREQVFKITPMPPRPPCPKPRNCNDWLDIVLLTPPVSFDQYQLTIYDPNQGVLAESVGEPVPLPGSGDLLNALELKWNTTDYKGEILVVSLAKDANGKEIESVLDSEIQ